MSAKEINAKSGKSADARQDRLKAALKANMARRKAQAKRRRAQKPTSQADQNE